jgi:hypothetical protein
MSCCMLCHVVLPSRHVGQKEGSRSSRHVGQKEEFGFVVLYCIVFLVIYWPLLDFATFGSAFDLPREGEPNKRKNKAFSH